MSGTWRAHYEGDAGLLLSEIARLTRELAAASGRWVLVTERLPKAQVEVLASARGYTYLARWCQHSGGWMADGFDSVLERAWFSHWAPLPAPPPQEKQ